jgi:hypothetical protein
MALKLPGIVVRVVNDTGVIAPPVYERYPVIIGEGDPYKIVRDTKIFRSLGVVDSIPTSTNVHEIVSVGDLPGVPKYVDGTDYILSGNTISWNFPGGAKPTTGDAYYITFTEDRPASAYVPTLYFDENLIYADHGEWTRTSGSINDVSVGGSLALNAGCKGVIIAQLDLSAAVDPDSPTLQELENAFIDMRDELNKITDYKLFLVPMSSGTLQTTSAATIFFNHAVLCSQPEKKQERTVIASLPKGTSYSVAATFAQSYAHERMVVPFPYEATSMVVGDATEYDSRFYSATIAGKLCSTDIGINITDEIMPNINITDNYEPDIMTWLVQRGVGPAKIRGDIVRNVFIGTTDTTSALTEDLGVQDVKDYVKKYWREGLWAIYRNKPITKALLMDIRNTSVNILDSLVGRNIIVEYRSINVAQDNTEPRQVNITGKIKPEFGLQWMDVTFTFVISF